MDSKDIELKSALDEIFGDDIIELNEDIPVIAKNELTNEELFENTSTLVFNQNDIIDAMEEFNSNEESVVNSEQIPNTIDKIINENNKDYNSILHEFSLPMIDMKNDSKENNAIDSNLNSAGEQKEIAYKNNNLDNAVKEKNSNIPIKKVIIISIIVVLLTLVGVYFIVNYISNREKVINCSYLFDDKNYKITDEYKITFKNRKITYIEGVYIYSSKTNDYDEQIRYIKEDKLPVIINSNGMKGFTYTYENTDDSIKISSYLDYTIMDEKEINSIDQDVKPISYFEVNLNENNKNLIKSFEKQGYKCITSK